MFELRIKIDDKATPILKAALVKLSDKKALHDSIAAELETTIKEHIVKIAPSKHATANRLGARPTGYLGKQNVEAEGRSDSAVATISPGHIFKRAFGKVTVRGRGKKLTIPATAEAYGKRAREIEGLVAIRFKRGLSALVKLPPNSRGKIDRTRRGNFVIYYWLKDSVTLPQDKTLLPTRDEIAQAAERGAKARIQIVAKEALKV